MFKTLTLAASLTAALTFSACAVQDTAPTGDLALEETDLSGVGKADHLSLNFSELAIHVDHELLQDGGAAIVTSAGSFQDYFGVPAPADLDFDHEWVAFYGVGIRSTGGFSATITDVSVVPDGSGIVLGTNAQSPGPDCLVTMALTTPHTIVRFDRPQTMPQWFTMDSKSETYKCGPDNADRLAELAASLENWNAARDASNNSYTYTSEFHSWLGGINGRTTIVIENGIAVERHYKEQHQDGSEGTVWSEFAPFVGSHFQGARAVLIDELYTQCAEQVLILDEDDHWINLFIGSDDGIMRSCQASHRLCQDDCSQGPSIATISFDSL